MGFVMRFVMSLRVFFFFSCCRSSLVLVSFKISENIYNGNVL